MAPENARQQNSVSILILIIFTPLLLGFTTRFTLCPQERQIKLCRKRQEVNNVQFLFLAPRGQIYEATVEMDPDYLNVSCQSDMFSPTKPLPVPQSTDVYYSDVGMNVHGGYQKLLKEMNIPNDPSSIQALLQLSAHLANQNGAAPHNQNR